jgi:hypothetical protein
MEWKTEDTTISSPSKDNLDWVLTRLGKAEAENVQYYAAYKEAEGECRKWKIISALVGAMALILQYISLWWKL